MILLSRPCRLVRPTSAPTPPNLLGVRPYQARGIAWLRWRMARRRNALLGDDMGLGKTAQAARALPDRARAIVCCPAMLFAVWREELARWRPDLQVGELRDRAPREGEVLLVSRDNLPEHFADDLSDVILIFDEAHGLRRESAERTRRARLLVARCGRGNVWGLTGTPMVGTEDDLLGLLTTLDLLDEAFPGTRKMSPQREFRSITKRMVTNEVVIAARLQRVMLRRTVADHLDLPPVRWIDVPVEAPADLRDELDAISEAWRSRYDPDELPPLELYSEAMAALARSRRDAARDLAEECARARPTIVFSAHLDPIYEVGRLSGAVVLTSDEGGPEAIAMFKRGDVRILAATIQKGGVGHNVPQAGAVILVDETYTPADTEQAIRRAVRPGQKHPDVLVYRMVSDHPLDVRIREIHDIKRALIDQTIEASSLAKMRVRLGRRGVREKDRVWRP